MVISVLVECQMHDYQTGDEDDEDDGDEADDDCDGDDNYCNDVIISRQTIYTSLASEESSVKSK